jgi:AcrR family transcriptional regulator
MEVNEQSAATTRRYHSPKRQRQADATRRRILAYSARLFAERGYAATTMEAIARAAGISVAALYLHFPGRAAVVGALAQEIASAPELDVEQVVREADPIEQLRVAARNLRQVNERAWLIADILRGQAGNDPDIAQLWAAWQQGKLEATRRGVAAIAERGGLRPGQSVEMATDVFYALGGTEVYRALVIERGWSPKAYERWLFETGCRELLPQPRSRP